MLFLQMLLYNYMEYRLTMINWQLQSSESNLFCDFRPVPLIKQKPTHLGVKNGYKIVHLDQVNLACNFANSINDYTLFSIHKVLCAHH